MADTTSVTVACHCRAFSQTYDIPNSSLPLKQFLCHCNICRHVTGAPTSGYLTIASAKLNEVSGLDKLSKYSSSHEVDRYFCPSCGTHLFVYVIPSDNVCFASGTFDRIEGLVQTIGHEFVEDTLDGGVADFLPTIRDRTMERWAAWPHHSETVPDDWTHADASPSKPDDTLAVHCHCKGVEFRISKPGAHSRAAGTPYPDPADASSHPWWEPKHGKYLAGLCGCESCRKSFGFEPTAWAFVPCADITKADGSAFERYFGTMKSWRSSKDVTRVFCATCGATVFWDGDERPLIVDVAVGLMAAPSGVRALDWLYWRTSKMSFKEDALDKELLDGYEAGAKAWGDAQRARDASSVM